MMSNIIERLEFPIDAYSYSKIVMTTARIQNKINKYNLNISMRKQIYKTISKLCLAILIDELIEKIWPTIKRQVKNQFSIYYELIAAFQCLVYIEDRKVKLPHNYKQFVNSILSSISSFENMFTEETEIWI